MVYHQLSILSNTSVNLTVHKKYLMKDQSVIYFGAIPMIVPDGASVRVVLDILLEVISQNNFSITIISKESSELIS